MLVTDSLHWKSHQHSLVTVITTIEKLRSVMDLDSPYWTPSSDYKVLESRVPNLVARLKLKLVELVNQTNSWSFLDFFFRGQFLEAIYYRNCEVKTAKSQKKYNSKKWVIDEKETCPRDGFGKILQEQVNEDDQRTSNGTRPDILIFFRTEKDS